jgi:hypothetical protein
MIMTWGWDARGKLPASGASTGTTGGGSVGTRADAGKTKAWPRYEAEYLKRALTSERYKYDTEGLDDQQKGVYLDRVVANYKQEADECLKAEFEQWLQGQHEANDTSREQIYENADGKPVRRWVFRSPEATDETGGSKVGQARAGWKHTPWGRASLVHLDGVREYLRSQEQDAQSKDMQMQLLAEMGPQNIEQAWAYFKHWVKGRPLSDAVALPARFPTDEVVHRSEFGHQAPNRMYYYDSEPNDRQPGVLAQDHNARNAAVALPGEAPKELTTEAEDKNLQDAKDFRAMLEGMMRPSAEKRDRVQNAEVRDEYLSDAIDKLNVRQEARQELKQADMGGPTVGFF